MTSKPTYEELQAQVEALRDAGIEALKFLTYPAKRSSGAQASYDKLSCALAANPQHHLLELRAEAVEQAVNETKKLESTPCGQWWYCLADDLKKCADSIRQGGAE